MSDSTDAKRVKQAVGDVLRKYTGEGLSYIDLEEHELKEMWENMKAAISKALPEAKP